MYALPEYRLLYLAVPATASVATGNAILAAGGVLVGTHHQRPPDCPNRMRKLGYDETWTTVCTLRSIPNWFESLYRKRLVSGYHDDVISKEWINKIEKDERWFTLHCRSPFARYTPYVNVIWTYETLQDDIWATCSSLGIPLITLERQNVSVHQVPTWSEEAREYVNRRYQWQQTQKSSMSPMTIC